MLRRLQRPSPEETFAFFFKTYRDKLFGYVLAITHSRHMAEDITQEVFLKLWLCCKESRQIDHPENYLFTAAKNTTINYLRNARHREKLLAEMKDLMIDGANDVESLSAGKECERLVLEAITGLPPRSRHIYRLSRDQGLSHKQIATLLGISPNTVKNHLVHALKLVRGYLSRHGVLRKFIVVFSFLKHFGAN